MAKIQTLEQERAAFAWKKVNSVGSDRKEYKNLSKGAPALLMTNGLMQTLAFYNSRGREPAKLLAGHIQEWLKLKIADITDAGFEKVMADLQKCEPAVYMRATDEALEILRWIRQFADALIKED